MLFSTAIENVLTNESQPTGTHHHRLLPHTEAAASTIGGDHHPHEMEPVFHALDKTGPVHRSGVCWKEKRTQ